MKASLQSVEDLTMFQIDNDVHYCRAIPGYDGYWASTLGNIISTKKKKSEPTVLAGMNDRGYLKVCLRRDGRKLNRKVHRLVAAAFLKSPDVDPEGDERIQINHLDSDKHNNRAANLEYSSARENVRHARIMAEARANG